MAPMVCTPSSACRPLRREGDAVAERGGGGGGVVAVARAWVCVSEKKPRSMCSCTVGETLPKGTGLPARGIGLGLDVLCRGICGEGARSPAHTHTHTHTGGRGHETIRVKTVRTSARLCVGELARIPTGEADQAKESG